MALRDQIPAWEASSVAQRLEQCRVMLVIHGYLRDSESDRIKAKLKRDWDASAPEGATR